jgi:hypothetical protein
MQKSRSTTAMLNGTRRLCVTPPAAAQAAPRATS